MTLDNMTGITNGSYTGFCKKQLITCNRVKECNGVCPFEDALSAEAVQGEWILVKGSDGKDYHKCSKCLHTQEITGAKNYCAVCGARMKGGAE